jgi:hypothetical protein
MKRTIISVTGMTVFPLDMLRHDHAFPCSSEDAKRVHEQIENPTAYNMKRPNWADREIKLAVEAGQEVTVARWNSFGWSVDVVQVGEIVG